MSNLTIFKQPGAVANPRRGVSELTKSAASSVTVRRIQTNTNGTFKRLVNGEQIGKAIRGEFNAIIINFLPKPSRQFYAGKYDPDAKGTMPDCWSNLGDKPEAKAENKQSANCANCPKNIDGSGENGKGKACRFQRRVALLLEGDESGDVYQFNIPAKSLFGKGTGNTHPFESYVRYLVANEQSVDYVVTNIAYNLDAETMELQFTPVRPISDEEYDLVVQAQSDAESQRVVQMTVAEADGATSTKAVAKEEPKKSVFKEEAKAPEPEAEAEAEDAEFEEVAEEAPPAEPVKRASAKKPAAVANVSSDVMNVINAWADDDEDEID